MSRHAKLITNPLTKESKTAHEWAEYLGLSSRTFYHRLKKYNTGLVDAEYLFKPPVRKPSGIGSYQIENQKFISNPLTGKRLNYSATAESLNIDYNALINRLEALKEGRMTVEEVFTPKPDRVPLKDRQKQKLRDLIIKLQENK